GVGTLDELVSTRAECMKQPEGAELFSTSLIRPQRAIPSLRQQAAAYYRITSANSREKLILWNEDEQRVLSSRPGEIELVVRMPDISPADAMWRLPHADTPEFHRYLQPSAYLEVDSPEIQALARQAVGSERNPVVAARRIEYFVANYITKKDLRIGFASAEETAKSREGDCTEHAVLCAALGRAVGLPTRCVLGLGYIPPGEDEPTIANAVGPDTGIFGFHMWAEAWIGPGKWLAMDAALGGFDVGHIAITKSALEEVNPLTDLNLPILQLLEKIRIEVLKTETKAKASAAKDSPYD
ncbi:MAG: transglutaminase-like domain-containing protein, partial [Bryobacteraceae bacterium]